MKKAEIFELILLSDLPLPEKQDVYDYINSLECCGNCKHEVPEGHYTEKCHNCKRSKQYCNPVGCYDNWEHA